MKADQLTHANTLHAKMQKLKGTMGAIRGRIKPQGPNATPQLLNKDGNRIVFSFTVSPLEVEIPENLAQKFLDELDRYYDGELLSAEREFERL